MIDTLPPHVLAHAPPIVQNLPSGCFCVSSRVYLPVSIPPASCRERSINLGQLTSVSIDCEEWGTRKDYRVTCQVGRKGPSLHIKVYWCAGLPIEDTFVWTSWQGYKRTNSGNHTTVIITVWEVKLTRRIYLFQSEMTRYKNTMVKVTQRVRCLFHQCHAHA